MTAALALVRKDARALLPLWASLTFAIWLSSVADGLIGSFAGVIYAIAPLVLGAFAAGYEQSHRTLESLLTQPIRRHTVFVTRFLVLAVMLAVMFGIKWVAWSDLTRSILPLQILLLPVLGGLLVAPWFTLLCRNQMAGVVFPLGLAGLLFSVFQYLESLDNAVGDAIAPVADVLWQWGLVGFAVVAGVLGWRTFLRLEVIEGGGLELNLPASYAAGSADRGPGALRSLMLKELRLQQMTLALLTLYAVLFIMVVANVDANRAGDVLAGVTAMFALGVSLLAGSLASAEERQLGILDVQRLLPLSKWTQWALKVAMTYLVAIFVGLVVPAGLIIAARMASLEALTAERLQVALGGGALVIAVSMWVSSLMNSPTRALAASFAACGVLAYMVGSVSVFMFDNPGRVSPAPLISSLAVLGVFLLWCGAHNHSSSERRVWAVFVQITIAAMIVPLAIGPGRLTVLMRVFGRMFDR